MSSCELHSIANDPQPQTGIICGRRSFEGSYPQFLLADQVLWSVPRIMKKSSVPAFFKASIDHLFDNLEFWKKHCCFGKKAGQSLLKFWTQNLYEPCINPFGPKSDHHQFSPNNISRSSRLKVMRITKLITKGRTL